MSIYFAITRNRGTSGSGVVLVIRGWGVYIAKVLGDYEVKFLK